jgi:hypothetical protein
MSPPVYFYSKDEVHELDSQDLIIDHPVATADYLSLLRQPGMPNHELRLKPGALAVLMRNFSVKDGLVKNARVLVRTIRRNYVEVSLIQDDDSLTTSENYLLPCINFEFRPPNTNFTVRRKQFPLRLAYATTFNSCQGMTLERVVVDLRTEVFAHGQLYTALSRIRSKEDAMILMQADTLTTKNVVYRSLLQ